MTARIKLTILNYESKIETHELHNLTLKESTKELYETVRELLKVDGEIDFDTKIKKQNSGKLYEKVVYEKSGCVKTRV